LELTLAEVRKLKKEHLVEIKSFTTPSEVIVLVCQAVIILTYDIIKARGGDIVMKMVDGKKKEDWFDTAKKYLLANP